MESEIMINKSSFNEMKESINELISMFKYQVKQSQQSDMLQHILSSKIDLQSERLSSLEKSLEEIKEMMIPRKKSSESAITPEHLVEGDGDNEKVSKGVIKRDSGNVNDSFDDRESAFGQELIEFKALVLKNVTDLGNVCIENTADVMMRLDEADKKVFSKFGSLIETTADIKRVLKQVEDLDRSIKLVENNINKYSENMNSLVFDTASTTSILNEIKTNTDKLVISSNGTRDELVLKLDEHFNTTSKSSILNQIKTNTDKQVIFSKETRDELLRLDKQFNTASKFSILNQIKTNIDNQIILLKGARDEHMLKLDEQFNKSSNVLKQIKANTDKQVILSKGTRDELLSKLDEQFNMISEISRNTYHGASGCDSSSHYDIDIKNRLDKQITRQYWSIIEQIISENQITREILLEIRKPRDSYKCDLFVKDFSKLIKSQKEVFSNLWYFDQLTTHLKGVVRFTTDGQVEIGLDTGKNHRKCGLDPKRNDFVEATVFAVMIKRKNWELGSRSSSFDENTLGSDRDCWERGYGYHLATIPCEVLERNGYIDNNDRLILRYEVTFGNDDYEDSGSYEESENYDDFEDWCP